jgi:hypothetical protein
MAETKSEPAASPNKKRKVDESTNTGETRHPPGTEFPEKRQRTIGPALPPSNIDGDSDDQHRDESSEESEDDYGPTLPPKRISPPDQEAGEVLVTGKRCDEANTSIKSTGTSEKSRRDDWMLRLPDPVDWSSRVDPTKLRNRRFNLGKGATTRVQSGEASGGIWTETLDEKKKRLENEILGAKAPAASSSPVAAEKSAVEEEMAKRVQAYNVGCPNNQ